MSAEFLPEALELARRARREFPRDQVTPSRLYTAAERDVKRAAPGALELRRHYRHAMTEAGMLVETRTGQPFARCPECGWKLDA